MNLMLDEMKSQWNACLVKWCIDKMTDRQNGCLMKLTGDKINNGWYK